MSLVSFWSCMSISWQFSLAAGSILCIHGAAYAKLIVFSAKTKAKMKYANFFITIIIALFGSHPQTVTIYILLDAVQSMPNQSRPKTNDPNTEKISGLIFLAHKEMTKPQKFAHPNGNRKETPHANGSKTTIFLGLKIKSLSHVRRGCCVPITS